MRALFMEPQLKEYKNVRCNALLRREHNTARGTRVQAKYCEQMITLQTGIDPNFWIGHCPCGNAVAQKKNENDL